MHAVHGKTLRDFEGDQVLKSAVMWEFTVMGEAANHISEEMMERHPEVPWVEMIDFRNFLIHGYFVITLQTVWTTITEQVPEVERAIQALMSMEYPDRIPQGRDD
jgi:uncharacterized protein with HEPN domain